MSQICMLVVSALLSQANTEAPASRPMQPPHLSDLSILSPLEYEVFQRQSAAQGAVFLAGRVGIPCDRIEVRISGKSTSGPLPGAWEQIAPDSVTGGFGATVAVRAGGWYQVEIRAMRAGRAVAQGAVAHVGVGEVFIGAGQSNSTNCGGEGKLKTESGLVSTFDGATWRVADDPQPGTHDRSTGGSFWPAFGDALVEKYHVPVAVAVTGHGGTSIKQWEPGGELFQWTLSRMQQLGRSGFRGVLWHQGEADVQMKSEDYAAGLARIIAAFKSAAGWEFPWFVAQVSYHNPSQASFASTRDGQKMLWDMKIALEGPDTDTLTGDNRDDGGKGIHFSPKGLRAHGRMWAEKVGVYLDRVLTARGS